MTVDIQLNGEPVTVSPGVTVQQIVAERSSRAKVRAGRGVAVAVNGEVVPRSMWDETIVNAGDRVELLDAVGGG
jgi:sulfur carrier protein